MLDRDTALAELLEGASLRIGLAVKVSYCWELLDQLARLPVEPKQLPIGRLVHEAQLLLRRQGAPGWREGEDGGPK